jgi:hypothetical protein
VRAGALLQTVATPVGITAGTRLACPSGMAIPLQLTFRHMTTSEAVEADIRAWVEALEGLGERITSCRVTIEAPHQHHHHGGLYRVLIQLALPSHRIIVGRSPGEDHAHEDLHVAIRDAFRAARRRVEDHLQRQRGEVKHHETAAPASTRAPTT